MARPQAMEKGYFYKTAIEVLEMFFQHHVTNMYIHNGGILFDPCAGKGEALARLAELMIEHDYSRNSYVHTRKELITMGVELDHDRAETAAKVLDTCLAAGIEQVKVKGDCNVLFLNPPYTSDHEGRVEWHWLRNTLQHLRYEGTAFIVIKHELAMDPKLMELLNSMNFDIPEVWKFPEPYFTRDYGQALVVVRKRYSYSATERKAIYKGIIGETVDKSMAIHFGKRLEHDWEKLVLKKVVQKRIESPFKDGVPQEFIDYTGEGELTYEVQPLQALSPETSAVVVAAGAMTGERIESLVIRGDTIIRLQTVPIEGSTTDTETYERQIARISTLDLKKGKVDIFNQADDPDKFANFFRQYGEILVQKAREKFVPLYDGRIDPRLDTVRAPVITGEETDGMLPEQAERASMLLLGWTKEKGLLLQGDMGVGKTITSIGAMLFLKTKKCIVFLPAKDDLADKWIEEIELASRDMDNVWAAHAKTPKQIAAAFARPGRGFICIKETTAKSSTGWVPIYDGKMERQIGTEKVACKCPDCGHKIDYSYKDREGFKKHYDPFKRRCECQQCGSALWQHVRTKDHKPIMKEIGHWEKRAEKWKEAISLYRTTLDEGKTVTTRGLVFWLSFQSERLRELQNEHIPPGRAGYPMAKFIREHYGGQYTLIADEAHGTKGGDTAIGYASQDLVSGASRVLYMTGTIYNGYASSIFFLLYRLSHKFRQIFAYNDSTRFSAMYGLSKTVKKLKKGETTYSGYDKYYTQVKEIPGMDPRMTLLLLDIMVQFKLRDLGLQLPKLQEWTLFVDPEPYQEPIRKYLKDTHQLAVSLWRDGDASLLGKHTAAREAVWDMTSDSIHKNHAFDLDIGNDVMLPKEQALVRLVNMLAPRNVLVYITQPDRRDVTPRLIPFLEKYGVKSAVVRANQKKRLDFIRGSLNDGCRVVFTNPSLVDVGINLTEFSAIVWYGCTWNLYTMLQANRRIYRLNQTEDCDIYYLGYQGTDQAKQLITQAEKSKATSKLQGDPPDGLAEILGSVDFVTELQSAVSSSKIYASDMTMDDLPPLPAPSKIITSNGSVFSIKKQALDPSVFIPKELVGEHGQLSLF